MTDILLIQPPVRDFYLTRKRTIPYGLASIAAVLIQNGFTVELFDSLATSKSRELDYPEEMEHLREFYGNPDQSPFGLFHRYFHFGYSYEHIRNVARRSKACLVGISSLFSAYHQEALSTAEEVKKVLPNCKIVIGGHHATTMPETVMENSCIDYLIRGEGEAAMTALVTAIRQKRPVRDIPGIVCRNHDGTLYLSSPAVMSDLNEFPLPAMHLVKKKYYQRNRAGSIAIVASRGCPMKCSYCSVGASGLPYRRRSVESVIREIDRAVRLDSVRFIDFEDENLSMNNTWFLELLQQIENRFRGCNLELRAMNGLYPPSLDLESIARMKAAGFQTLNLSLGTTSPSQLQRFSRPDVRKDLESVIQMAAEMNLDTVCYIIAGAPGQEASDSVRDLLYLYSLKTIVGVSIFYPAPGSPDYQMCQRMGLLPQKLSMLRSTAFPISHTTRPIQSATILRLGRISNFMKSLVQKGTDLPEPQPFCEMRLTKMEGREEKGRQLLAWFLNDGKIRGVLPDGHVYEHWIDRALTRQFLDGLQLPDRHGSNR